jgi:hypothetical protein
VETTRRTFLKSVFAGVALTAAPMSFARPIPKIYSDGIHDDLAGLQAVLNGEPFYLLDEMVIAQQGYIKGGNFLLSNTLVIKNGGITLEDSVIKATEDFQEGNPLISMNYNGKVSHFKNCTLITNGRMSCTILFNGYFHN